MRMEGPLFSADLSPPPSREATNLKEALLGPAAETGCLCQRWLSQLTLEPGVSLLTSQPAFCALHGLAGLPSPLNLSQTSATPWVGGHPESIWHQFPQLLSLVHVTGDLRDEKKA